MKDLTKGYGGNGKGNCMVLEEILKWNRNTILEDMVKSKTGSALLAKHLFEKNFMPYAKRNWKYHGSNCNCEHLSSAFSAVWDYIKFTYERKDLPKAEVTRIPPVNYLVTKGNLKVFAGPAKGNVRKAAKEAPDGRCLFSVHYLCKIGTRYFDPTFDLVCTNPKDIIVEDEVTKLSSGLCKAKKGKLLYAHSKEMAVQFSDSWIELNAFGWISVGEWINKTSRTMHTRSNDLKKVDRGLKDFEERGSEGLEPLTKAFEDWYKNNPKEALSRNQGGVVENLKKFLEQR
ncbi:MAG: hypothetical protein IPL49_15295 [Saprospirales bacterium]|nr:hypothetical protein [Saprospirales bacterium]